MKAGYPKYILLAILLFSPNLLQAQTTEGFFSKHMGTGLLVLAAILLIVVIVNIADNFLQIEAKNMNVDSEKDNLSVFPKMKEIFAPKLPDFSADKNVKLLKKGFDISLQGEAAKSIINGDFVSTYALQPQNFLGISPIPKVVVEVGDNVLAGDTLYFDKKNPKVKHVAPVSGEVIAINRGAKRAIAEVVILADKEQKSKELNTPDLSDCSREQLLDFLLESGAWTSFRQRPYDIMANPEDMPRDIFISTFDTAPLAPDNNLIVDANASDFQKGLDLLAKLTDGSVILGLNAKEKPSDAFSNAAGVEKKWFAGKHPAGNVGVQIHNSKPMATSDVIWTMGVQDVIMLGKLISEKRYSGSLVVAVTGAELEEPKHIRTYRGAKVSDLLKGNVQGDNNRFISGDVLSGKTIPEEGYLCAYDDQITVIKEGNEYEMFGWLLPIQPRPTTSATFPNALLYPNMKFQGNTNTHGEKRAFVMTGQYEKVLPMDIYPQHLMKAIMAGDIERMEGLGIHEIVEEDIALAEFACTSKQPLQEILRDGLEMMIEQG